MASWGQPKNSSPRGPHHNTGVKHIHHPVVGDLTLTFEVLGLFTDAQALLTYFAEPGSRSEDGLQLLASWSTEPAEHRTWGRPARPGPLDRRPPHRRNRPRAGRVARTTAR